MFRDRGLSGAELAAKLAGASGLTLRERMDDRPAGAVGQGVKSEIESRTGIHSQLTIYSPGEIGNTEIPVFPAIAAFKMAEDQRGEDQIKGGCTASARMPLSSSNSKYTDDTH